MVLSLQPCDWIEHDQDGKYVVDVYGRTEETSGMVRIEGFKPYFYVLPGIKTIAEFKTKLTSEKITKVIVTEHTKYDAFAGFNNFQSTKVWKVEIESLRDWRSAIKIAKDIFPRLYESNIPPFLRLFHEREIGPASPITFQPSRKIEGGWCTSIKDVTGDPTKNIALKVAAYDIECTSRTGQFPMAIKNWHSIVEHFAEDLTKDEESTLTDILIKRLLMEGMVIPPSWREKALIPFLSKPSIEKMIDAEKYDDFARELGKLVNREIGDPLIQIGVTVRSSTDMLTNLKRRVFVWGSVEGSSEFVSCESEAEVIEKFVEFLQEENIDIVCGYNTFGFDDKYVHDRAQVNGMGKLQFGRTSTWGDLLEHKVFELASGKYNVNYLKMPGRLAIDLLLNMRREHNLDSYTLDNVASTFLRDKVVRLEGSTIHTKTTRGLSVGNFVRFDVVGNTINTYREGQKFLVKSISPKSFVIDSTDLFEDLSEDDRSHLEWSFTKDDIHPQDIFRMHDGSAEDRGTIAKYCIQDCDLVLTLMAKLDTLVNARGMADVCFVPFQYLFLRGQGIKIFSRVAYEASKRNQIIMTQENYAGSTAYEGAIVISPKIGMYLDTPVAVLDFNSLYPSSMIGENLSPDTLICMKTYNADGKLTDIEGIKDVKGLDYNEVSYDIKDGDEVTGKCVCLYVKPTEDNELSTGLIPRSLEVMLKKRKEARKKMEDPSVDDAQKSVYNGLQLAYKVVANSIYGQLGSKTSPIRKICVAACTTAVGRRQLLFAKSTVEEEYGGTVIYGDTDSIFITYSGKDLVESIKLAQESAELITSRCRHKAFVIGYEKTFYPFILFCRKRYVGMKYEEDPTKCYRASMGIVLKRRDNAPIVKDVFGGALDILLKEKNVKVAADYVKQMLLKVVKCEFPLEKFAITKQLRDDYKDPTRIAHRVLADRMTSRDPGNAPNVGDRLKFVYIQTVDKKLQGDKIEHIDYVKEKKLAIDTVHYVTNQIQNPVAQLFALCIDEMEGYKEPRPSYEELYEQYYDKLGDEEEATLKVLAHKEKHLEKLLFLDAPYLGNVVRNSRRGPLDAFFKRSTPSKN
jgi:DNA polymerase elongation subunit (family B)